MDQRENCNSSGIFTSSYKIQRTRVQNESPPWRAGQPFNEWPLQLLTHHTYRLYSSCMCWNYKSLKSHFENTIKTFFSGCDNLPSYKNLRPMLRQQDIYCLLQTVQAGLGTGWGGRKWGTTKEGKFLFPSPSFFFFSKETSAKVVWSLYPVSELPATLGKNAPIWWDFIFLPQAFTHGSTLVSQKTIKRHDWNLIPHTSDWSRKHFAKRNLPIFKER